MTTRLRLGLIGCGAIAREHLAALADVEDLELVAVAEPDRAATQRAGIVAPVVATHRVLLAEHRVDAVLVCTPPATHEAIAIDALSAGKHVLCEKPLAPDASATRRMLGAARAADRQLVMASKFRHVADVRKARELVQAGALGAPVLYQNVFCSRVAMRGRWNADPAIAGGGVLIDNGAHAVDLARLLVGRIDQVAARFAPKVQDVSVEDTVRILFTAENGCLGSIDLSWSVHRELDWYATLEGARGTLRLGWRESALKLEGAKEWSRIGSGYDKRAALAANLAEFARVVRGEAIPAPSPDECLDSVLVIDACYRAARMGAFTAVREGASVRS